MTNTTHTSLQQQWEQRWQAIEQAGGRYQYVMAQMKQHGFLVERKPIDNMPPAERERYKKQLKQEALEQRKLKKEAWQAYKANHIVYLGQGIYWSDDTSEDQWDATDGAKRLLESQLPTFKNAKALADQLNLTIPQLKGLCFHRDVATRLPYTHFTIAKRSGGERQIWSPIPRLKYAQRWILDNILNPMLIHGSAHGFVRGKSIVTNAENHTNSQLLVKMDIKDFFPSINWRRVKGVFRQAGYAEQLATLFAMLCTESPRQLVKQGNATLYVALAERCLPQGAPTSPALTNIICLNLDRRLAGLADKHGLRYSRYADDLTFSLASGTVIEKDAKNALISTLLGSVAKILSEEGFAINAQKTNVIHQGGVQQVTGLVVNGDGVPRVPRAIKRKLRAIIHNLEQGKPLRQGETFNQLRGYASWIAMAEPVVGQRFLSQLKAIELKVTASKVKQSMQS
ncbi:MULTISPECIES: reverse transcriptase family protein [unclassified Moraxella]|uniref:reverse transcriptase family protein n=1 Tax=unclassified Moraxella TaxID=2685852 RepID=UPI003AF8E3F1